MAAKKTLQEREKELRSLLARQTGREEIQELASRYCRVSGKPKPTGTSAITYIVVYEMEQGLIEG
jgi:hypothetical protein